MGDETQPRPTDNSVTNSKDQVLEQLLRSAAYAVDCAAAVFYALTEDALKPLIAAGPIAPGDYTAATTLWPDADTADLLSVNDTSVVTDWPVPYLNFVDGGQPRFAVALPVWNDKQNIKGALLVADEAPRAGLSTAQAFVLRTHAYQLGFWHAHEPGRARRLRLLEAVVVHARESVLITQAEPIDEPGPRIVYCNAAFTQITGYSESEVIGRSPRLLQNDHTERATLDRLRAALEQGQPAEVELLNSRRDGSPFWIELSIVPVAGENGRTTHWISVQRDISARKKREEIDNAARITQAEKRVQEAQQVERNRAEDQMYRDDLTQLRTRAFLTDRLQRIINRREAADAAEAPAEGYVLFLDLDRFKSINDEHGHRTGDLLLMKIARRLESCVRGTDTLARIGGDEFVILMQPAAEETDAIKLADRIRERIQTAFQINGQKVFSSCSIGIVPVSPAYRRVEDVLRDADTAMYATKTAKPGQYSTFTADMRSAVKEKLTLQSEFKQALVNDDLSPVYQPVYNPKTNFLWGVEALVRWHHPQRGVLLPGVFLPVARSMNAMSDLGAVVMRRACAQVAWWRAHFAIQTLCLSVNVSANELKHHRFITDLESVLGETGLPPDCFQMEITEAEFLHEPETVGERLEALRALGIRVALDDFGAGCASLESIDLYSIDTLKIDPLYIRRMLQSWRSSVIVESLIQLGRKLNMVIVAEGIETELQQKRITELDCPLAQGYRFARPSPPGTIEQVLTGTN